MVRFVLMRRSAIGAVLNMGGGRGKDLKKYFPVKKGLYRKECGHVRAVDGVTFSINKGETLGLVGESGCGKTTTGRLILRAVTPTGGTIKFHTPDGLKQVNAMDRVAAGPRNTPFCSTERTCSMPCTRLSP